MDLESRFKQRLWNCSHAVCKSRNSHRALCTISTANLHVCLFFFCSLLSPLLCKVHEQSKQILSSHYFPLLLFFCTESKPPNSTPTRLLSVRSMCQCFVVVHSVFSDRPTILEASRDFFSFHFCNSKTFIGIRVLVCLVCVCVCVSRGAHLCLPHLLRSKCLQNRFP